MHEQMNDYIKGLELGYQTRIKELSDALSGLIHHCEDYNRKEESFVLAMEIEKAFKTLKEYGTK